VHRISETLRGSEPCKGGPDWEQACSLSHTPNLCVWDALFNAFYAPGRSATCSLTTHVRSTTCHPSMTLSFQPEACVTPALHAFDSIVYSQAHNFDAFPELVTSVKRLEASCTCKRNVGITLLVILGLAITGHLPTAPVRGARDPQTLFLSTASSLCGLPSVPQSPAIHIA
jgi:hypothetical protein